MQGCNGARRKRLEHDNRREQRCKHEIGFVLSIFILYWVLPFP